MYSGPRAIPDRVYDNPWDLTPVELEVLQGIAQGKTNDGIALDRVVTVRAIEKSVANVLRKVTGYERDECPGIHRRVLAARIYWEHNRPLAHVAWEGQQAKVCYCPMGVNH